MMEKSGDGKISFAELEGFFLRYFKECGVMSKKKGPKNTKPVEFKS